MENSPSLPDRSTADSDAAVLFSGQVASSAGNTLDRLITSLPDCVWSLQILTGGGYRFRYISPTIERITGRPVSVFMSHPDIWRSVFPREDLPLVQGFFQRVLSGEIEQGSEDLRIVLPGGAERWVQLTVSLESRSPEGTVLNGILTEITASKQALLRLSAQFAASKILDAAASFEEAAPRLLQAVCDGLGWAVGEIWIASNGSGGLQPLRHWHKPSLSAHLPGGSQQSILKPAAAALWASVAGNPRPQWISDTALAAFFGMGDLFTRLHLLSACIYPVLLGEQVFAVMVFFSQERLGATDEISDTLAALSGQISQFVQRQRAEKALRDSELQIRALLNAIPDAMLRVRQDGRVLDFRPDKDNDLALPAGGSRDFSLADLGLTPDQVEGYLDAIRQAIETGEIQTREFSREFSAGTQHFEVRISRSAAEEVVCLVRNVTDQILSQEALQTSNEQLTRWVDDLEQRSREAHSINEMGEMLQICRTPQEASQVIAQFSGLLFPGQSGGVYLYNNTRNLMSAETTWGSETVELVFASEDCWALRRGRTHMTKPGTSLRCRHLGVKAADAGAASICIPMVAQGETLGLFYLSGSAAHLPERWEQLAVTISEHAAMALANLRLRESLRMQAIHDHLTHLFNRRYMEETLERELHRAGRHQRPIGVILYDVDHFKRFNDTYGREAGDALLQEIGTFLKNHIRAEDIACRYGGEEFLLILPESDLADTQERAQQIWKGLRNLNITFRGQPLGIVTVSAGVACYPQHGSTTRELIEKATSALIRAKNEGRDQVSVA